jgi:hypothetical protein
VYLTHVTVPDGHKLHETELNLGGIYRFITGISGISRPLSCRVAPLYLTIPGPETCLRTTLHIPLATNRFWRAKISTWELNRTPDLMYSCHLAALLPSRPSTVNPAN